MQEKNTKALIKLMLQEQDELNKVIHSDWRKQKFPWYRAIWIEAAEFLESFPWKWWAKKNNKTPDIDVDNVKIELADIWHFILSWTMETFSDPSDFLADIYEQVFNVCRNKKIADPMETAEFLVKAALERTLYFVVISFYELLFSFQFFIEELAKFYFGKNILNKFRQEQGIQNGKYFRIWDGVEDNQILAWALEEVSLFPLEDFKKAIRDELELQYISSAILAE